MPQGERRAHDRIQNGKKVHVSATRIKPPTKRLYAVGVGVLFAGVWIAGSTSPVWGSVVVAGVLGAWVYANRKPLARYWRRLKKQSAKSSAARVQAARERDGRAQRAAAAKVAAHDGTGKPRRKPQQRAAASRRRELGPIALQLFLWSNSLRLWWLRTARSR